MCISIYGDHTFKVRLKIEKSNDGGPDASFDKFYSTPGAWQQLCFDLLGPDINGAMTTAGFTYTRFTLFPEYGAVPADDASYYVDNIVKITGGGQPPASNVIADWDGTDLTIAGSFGNGHFADSIFAIVANPNPSGINMSANVQNWQKANNANTWGGFYYDPPEALDLTGAFGQVCLSVYGDHVFKVRVKIEKSNDGGPDLSFDLFYTAPGEWQQLCYNLMGMDVTGAWGSAAGFTYTRITIFPEFGVTPADDATYYVDDIFKVTGGGSVPGELISDYEPSGITVDMVGSFGNGHFAAGLFPVVANPSPDGVNSSSMVQEWCKANDANTWGGWFMDVDTLDFTGTEALVCVSILADHASLLRLKLEGSATGPDLSIDQNYTTPNEWQVLCFDYTQPDVNGNTGLGHQYHRITVFPDFGTVPASDACYYLDNFYKVTNGGGTILQLLGNVIQASPDHTILTNLVNTADLWSEINASGVTVFAPTDDAFNALPVGQMDALMNNTDNALYNMLLHHVVYDTLSSSALTMGLHFITRNGQDGIVTAANSGVANATITEADVPGVNGIMHVIDAVLEFPVDPAVYVHADYEDPALSPQWNRFGTQNNIESVWYVANPAPGGVNTSGNVVQYKRYPDPSATWQGIYIDLDRPLNYTGAMTQLCLDLWTDHAAKVRFKHELSSTTAPDRSWVGESVAANEWTTVCVNTTTPSITDGENGVNQIYNRLTFFFDFEDGTNPPDTVIYYFDNVVVNSTSTGTNEIQKLENFKFYPNPASDLITVESDTPIHEAIVFDIAGKQLFRVANPVSNQIDVSSLHGGMYFVNFRGESGELLGTVKLIKQ